MNDILRALVLLTFSIQMLIFSIVFIDILFDVVIEIDGFDWLELSRYNEINEQTTQSIALLGWVMLVVFIIASTTDIVTLYVFCVILQVVFFLLRFNILIINGGNKDEQNGR